MTRRVALVALFALAFFLTLAAAPAPQPATTSQPAQFKALAFYSTKVEKAHVDFANDSLAFFSRDGKRVFFNREDASPPFAGRTDSVAFSSLRRAPRSAC